MTGDPREAYLTLALVPGIGFARFGALIAQFRTPEAVLAASLVELQRVEGIPPEAAVAICRADRGVASKALEDLAQLHGHLLLPGDSEFPALLREIPDPPLCLFALGRRELLSQPAVAIIGSRDHTAYGGEVCRALARAASAAGLVVVSGMARGLDAVAHTGALDAAGATIGVLGNGLGVIYPPANRLLYQRMEATGLLLTEFPPGERPGRGSFPRRNRLISGLARVVVVVEAADRSGTRQTVDCANDQGRDVMAVPGPICSPVSAGTNALIRDGAAPLLELADLLRHYPELTLQTGPPAVTPESAPLELRVINALQREPLLAEALIELLNAPVAEALDALSTLELRGSVTREAGGRYRLVQDRLFG